MSNVRGILKTSVSVLLVDFIRNMVVLYKPTHPWQQWDFHFKQNWRQIWNFIHRPNFWRISIKLSVYLSHLICLSKWALSLKQNRCWKVPTEVQKGSMRSATYCYLFLANCIIEIALAMESSWHFEDGWIHLINIFVFPHYNTNAFIRFMQQTVANPSCLYCCWFHWDVNVGPNILLNRKKYIHRLMALAESNI